MSRMYGHWFGEGGDRLGYQVRLIVNWEIPLLSGRDAADTRQPTLTT